MARQVLLSLGTGGFEAVHGDVADLCVMGQSSVFSPVD